MAVIVIATICPDPTHRDEVTAACEETVERVHTEPGVERYALHEGPDRLVIIEKYVSDQARIDHNNGPALAALATALHGKLTRELDVQVLHPLPAGDPAKGTI